MDTVAAFTELFVGNADAVGGENGRCIRRPEWEPADQWINQIVTHHLTGFTPTGFYPHYVENGQTLCVWGCVDIDEGDDVSWVHAQNLAAVLKELQIMPWVERSRSKGFHVWVFPARPIDAATMRDALQVAVEIAEAPDREINPKQTVLAPKPDGTVPVGNYVRAPYPHMWQENHRRCMVDELGQPIGLDVFLRICTTKLVPASTLQNVAAMLKPDTPQVVPHLPVTAPVEAYSSNDVLPGLVAHLVTHGPLDAQIDRSAWLWRLCRTMAEKHVPYSQAAGVLQEADRRWGKFYARPDGHLELARMLQKAYR